MWELLRIALVWLVIAGIVYGIAKVVFAAGAGSRAAREAKRKPPAPVHCMTCGEDSMLASEGAKRGNTTMEVLLWVLFLWPIALVYSVWRRIGKGAKAACPSCGATTLVPAASPAARAHSRQLAASIGAPEGAASVSAAK